MCARISMTYHCSLGACRGARRADRLGVFVDRPPPQPRPLASRHRGDRVVRRLRVVGKAPVRMAVFRVDAYRQLAGAWLPNSVFVSSNHSAGTPLGPRRTSNDERRTTALLLPPDPIEAEWPRPRRSEVEPQEAVQHRDLAAVLPPPEAVAAARVRPEIRDRHLAGRDERQRPRRRGPARSRRRPRLR